MRRAEQKGSDSESSSSSSSASDMVVADVGDLSSERSEEEAADPAKRGQCFMYSWPCPLEHPRKLKNRRDACLLKPSDISNKEFGEKFKAALRARGHGGKLKRLCVVTAQHKRSCTASGSREVRKLCVGQMSTLFAHERIRLDLAIMGINGACHFTFSGWKAYLAHLVLESNTKPQQSLDPDPYFYPRQTLPSAIAESRSASSSELARAKNRTSVLQEQAAAKQQQAVAKQLAQEQKEKEKERKQKEKEERTHMSRKLSFNEFSDIVIEHNFLTAKDLLMHAKSCKTSGDVRLWAYVGALKGEPQVAVDRVRAMWDPQNCTLGTCVEKPPFDLSEFIVPQECLTWAQEEWAYVALVIQGKPGLGNTELASSLMASITHSHHFLSDVDDMRHCRLDGRQGLVIDDVTFAHLSLDVAKHWFDVEKTRGVRCRSVNGLVPAQTPRICLTNWPKRKFMPHGWDDPDQVDAYERRVRWVVVDKDVRKNPPPPRIKRAPPPTSPGDYPDPSLHLNATALTEDQKLRVVANRAKAEAKRKSREHHASSTSDAPQPTTAAVAMLPELVLNHIAASQDDDDDAQVVPVIGGSYLVPMAPPIRAGSDRRSAFRFDTDRPCQRRRVSESVVGVALDKGKAVSATATSGGGIGMVAPGLPEPGDSPFGHPMGIDSNDL